MTIFALDTSGKKAGVSVLEDDVMLYTKTLDDGYTHSQTIIPLIKEASKQSCKRLEDIAAFAVTAGPGSFTGLRIGMSAIKGLAFVQNKPIYAVSTLAAAMLGCSRNGIIVPALDARRNEVYWAAFAKNEKKCERLSKDDVSAIELIGEEEFLCNKNVVFVGDGAELCYNAYKQNNGLIIAGVAETNISYGAALCVAYKFDGAKPSDHATVYPSYIRASQAERERAQKMANKQ